MNNDYAIEVKDLKKKFKVYYDKGSQLKERLLFKHRNRYEERWVLKGISFNVKQGEAIGLIGHNGCGKSTTLKLLTKIIYPDSGSVTMRGRVSSLIELGAGFHPDMTGRENIYTNAAIFGLSRKEIEERMDDIIRFSELEEFLDNPVRTYSSGMYMRLAFSIAINVDADILLIDEILAVGDVNFQAKCFNRLREIKAQGTTIVIVSHSLSQIEQICDRSIWIQDGLILAEGNPHEIHLKYFDYMGQKMQERQALEEEMVAAEEAQENNDVQETPQEVVHEEPENDISREGEEAAGEAGEAPETAPAQKERWGNGKAEITNITMLDEDGQPKNVFATGSKVKFVIEYKVKKKIDDAVFGIGIFRNDDVQIYGTNTRIDGVKEFSLSKGGATEVVIESLMLLPGEYYLDVAIESGMGIPVDYFRKAKRFSVYSAIGDVGLVRLEHGWSVGE